jgi:Ca2+/Na+ antiporter
MVDRGAILCYNTILQGNKMTKIQKTAALKTAMTVGSIALIVVAIRVLIELVGVQVFGALGVSAVLIGLIKMMYDNEVDKATLLDRLNNKEAK